MPVRGIRGDSSPRRPREEPELEEERLVHVLDGVDFLLGGSRERREPDRAAFEFLDDRDEQAAVDVGTGGLEVMDEDDDGAEGGGGEEGAEGGSGRRYSLYLP